jgi:hypothetical protein
VAGGTRLYSIAGRKEIVWQEEPDYTVSRVERRWCGG